MFKPFFVHINPHKPGKRTNKHPRGATIYVSPTDDMKTCQIQVAYCSPKDEFNKHIGRETAMNSTEIYKIPRRQLPRITGTIFGECGKGLAASWREQDYNHLLANFL